VVKRDSWLEEEWVSMQKKQRLVAEKKNKSGKGGEGSEPGGGESTFN
jgi:hypothetical protein